jgi:hypothetical protein
LKKHIRASALVITVLLGLIILGGYAAAMSQAAVVEVKVLYLPWVVDLAKPPTCGIYAIIYPPRGYNPRDINPDKILLEDMLAPIHEASCWIWFVAEFSPREIVGIIWAKIYHMGLPSGMHVINLKITGEFKNGTPFEGIGKMLVKI